MKNQNRDIIVGVFDWPVLRPRNICLVLAVYKSPKDYPDQYVARVFDADKPTRLVFVADTYRELVDRIPIQQLTRLDRHPEDDPAIVEVWV